MATCKNPATLTFCASALLIMVTQASAGTDEPRWVPGRLLVQPQPNIDTPAFDAVLKGHGARSKGLIGSLPVHIIEVPEHAEEAVATALSHNPNIKFAEKDMLLPPLATSANDLNYTNAWHLDKLQAPVAWDTAKGDGVTVAILDTGVDASHPDLQTQLVAGWNTFDGNSDTSAICSHGTSVAGIVAAASNNTIGVTSIAWNTKIMPMRITGADCWASSSAIASALNWAADRGARVANISFADVSGSSTVTTAAEYMRSKGGVVLAASGNTGTQSSISPNASIIVVSATDSNDLLKSWSTYGNLVDIAAPGDGIWTTLKGGGYGTFSGTSAATPVAAGVAALIISTKPSLSASDVETILTSSSVDLSSPGVDVYFGHGRVDAAAAVAMAVGYVASTDSGSSTNDTVVTTVVDTTPPTVAISNPAPGSTVSGTVQIGISAQDNVGVALLKCYVNGALTATSSSSSFSCNWNTRKESAGAHTLEAKAEDAAGNVASVSISVNIGATESKGNKGGKK